MALMFEYKAGMNLADPWAFTSARGQPAYFIDSTGTLVQATANAIRDRHYPFGRGTAIRTTLFEPSAINRIRQSQALATTWSPNNATSVTNNAATAPDGTATATSFIPNATSTPFHHLNQAVTITSAEFCAVSIYVKANGYNGIVFRLGDAGSANGFQVTFDMSTGLFGTQHIGIGAGVLTGFKAIPLVNGWYRIEMWGAVNGAVTAGQVFVFTYDTVANADAGASWSGNTTSGSYLWGVQVERNNTTPRSPTSYMATTVADSTARGNDSLSVVWPYQTMPMWAYVSYYDLGGHISTVSAPILTLCDGLNHDPAWCALFMRNSGAPGASYGSGVGTAGLISSNRNTVDSGLAAVQPYDFVEVYSTFAADGGTKCSARKNGGAISTGGPISATSVPFVDIKATVSLFLGYAGALGGTQCGVLTAKIGADPTRVTTLAMAASA